MQDWVSMLAEQWVIPVLGTLADRGPCSYEDLLIAAGEDITGPELNSTIATLEGRRLVTGTRPAAGGDEGRAVYELTESGRTLSLGPLSGMAEWYDAHYVPRDPRAVTIHPGQGRGSDRAP
jgi:DNA-binding HxlR family transcriptional regulator